MLKKKNRADKKEIDLLFKSGKFLNSPNLSFKFINSSRSDLDRRISFIAPKSAAKLAVKRNFLRRRGYDALKKYLDQFPAGILGAFVFRKYQDDVSIIENEIKNILSRL
ncbi:MAG: ribonuclease P protein component [Minisyncoccia bacterium]